MPSVLIVDDVRFIRVLLVEILEDKGYEVAGEATEGEEAIEMYGKLKPDLVIMDIAMPGMDGITALKHIRTIDPEAKVIVISAYGTKKTVLKAIQAGAGDFIVKPFEPEQIISAISKVFGDE